MISINPSRRPGRPSSSDRLKTDECDYRVAADPELLELLVEEQSPTDRLISAKEGMDLTFTADDGHQWRQRVRILITRQRRGKRYWWACPSCRRRCRDLYAPTKADLLACRKCHRLVYRIQYWQMGPLEWVLWRFIREGPALFERKPRRRRKKAKPHEAEIHRVSGVTTHRDESSQAQPRPQERVERPEVSRE